MRGAGFMLLLIGFSAASFVAVQQADSAKLEWQTINWAWYGAAMTLGMAGIIMMRVSQRRTATHSHKLEADIDTLIESLDNLVSKLESLNRHREKLNVYDVHGRIDMLLMDDLSNFVEARESLIHVYDLQKYADLMSEFAVSERYVNRAWSASADGYIDEVWTCMDVAETRMRKARSLLQLYQSHERAAPSPI